MFSNQTGRGLIRLLRAGAALIVLLVPGHLAATQIIFRPMPSSNVNAPVNRSNYALNGDPWYLGDAFWIPDSSVGGWRIDSITTWSVGTSPNIGEDYSTIALYGALAGYPTSEYTGLVLLSTGDIDLLGNISNPSITSTRVYYTGDPLNPVSPIAGADFLSESSPPPPNEIYYPVFENTFNNLNWVVDGGTYYYIAVTGTARDPANGWYNHLSTGFVGDVTGGDGNFNTFDPTPALFSQLNIDPVFVDMNAIMTGDEMPEPATFVLLGLGLGGVFILRRIRR